MMKRVFGVCFVAAFLVVGVQSKAEAVPTLMLHICQGGTCTDIGPGSSVTTGGPIIVGDYTVGATGQAFEGALFSNSATTGINVQRTGNTSATPLDIWLSALGYTSPAGNQLTLDVSLGATRGGGPAPAPSAVVSYQGYVLSPTNAVPAYPPGGSTASPLISCTPPVPPSTGTTACSAAAAPSAILGGAGSFSITTRTTFTIGIGDNSSLYGSTGQATVTAQTVPEPASLLFLGTGLVGLAGTIRRRLRKS